MVYLFIFFRPSMKFCRVGNKFLKRIFFFIFEFNFGLLIMHLFRFFFSVHNLLIIIRVMLFLSMFSVSVSYSMIHGRSRTERKKTHRTIQMKQWDKLKVLFFCLLIWSYGAPAVYTGDCCIIIIWQLDSFGFFSGEKKATLFLLHTMFNDTFFPSILSIFRVA